MARCNCDLADSRARAKAKVAARALLLNDQPAGWEFLFPFFTKDTTFGREVFIDAVEPYGLEESRAWVSKLAARHVADLFFWLDREFPRAEDPKDESARLHAVSPRESVADFRDSLIRQLVGRNDDDAVAALRGLAERLPDQRWIREAGLECRKATRRQRWTPIAFAELLEIFSCAAVSRGEGMRS